MSWLMPDVDAEQEVLEARRQAEAVARMKAAFAAEGYCTDCWVNTSEEPHEDHCQSNTSRNREVQSDSEVSK